MSEIQPKNTRRVRRTGRALLVLLLMICLAGAAYLAYRGALELMERREGDNFYARLAVAAETPSPAVPEADAAAPQPAADAQPSPTAPVNRSEIDFPALWQTCPDVVGWIRLNDSVIDYPVVLGEDNDFYLHHLPDGTANSAGSIMMDQANSGDFTDTVNILHGHHMRSGSMFGRLADYSQKDYYETHPIMRLYTPAGDYDIAIFAAYTVDGYTFGYPTSFEDEAAFAQFVRRAVSATPYETGVDVQYGDRILLLSTCAYAYTGARFVVMGKIVEPE